MPELCPEHMRELELICVTDKRKICTQCALFGTHKGHDVRQESEVAAEINMRVEVLMEMYQTMEAQREQLATSETYEA